VAQTAEVMASVKGITAEELAGRTTENAERLFQIHARR
jgi:Tat protein secretion system quality control protein TatD with DNase activity